MGVPGLLLTALFGTLIPMANSQLDIGYFVFYLGKFGVVAYSGNRIKGMRPLFALTFINNKLSINNQPKAPPPPVSELPLVFPAPLPPLFGVFEAVKVALISGVAVSSDVISNIALLVPGVTLRKETTA